MQQLVNLIDDIYDYYDLKKLNTSMFLPRCIETERFFFLHAGKCKDFQRTIKFFQ